MEEGTLDTPIDATGRPKSLDAGRMRFVAAIFAGSFLLFLVQPMVARMALPRLGGAPSVWNSAMLVYQALLLGGYAYAHWLGRLQPRGQAAVHLALLVLAGLTLPIGLISAIPPPDANPFLWVPRLLLLSVGPLFFVVSAQAPLLQRWFALTEGGDPYPLYAASNFGSFGGLLAYPLLVEPLLPISAQRWLWTGGYGLLLLLLAWCARGLPRRAGPAQSGNSSAPTRRQIVHWLILAAVPSGLILSTTLHITTDVIATPLLWVLPLAAYLLSFTVAFAARRNAANALIRLAPLILLFDCFGLFVGNNWPAAVLCAVSVLNLFAVSVALHSRLFTSRPEPQRLTLFYLVMSAGGALGGLFCALVAPLIFNWTYEHLILLIAAAWLMDGRNPFARFEHLWKGRHAAWATAAGLVAALVLAVIGKGVFGLAASDGLNRIAVVAILFIAVFGIANRVLFAGTVAALLIAVGGFEQLKLSAEPGVMTRSFFGIYSIRPGNNGSRLLVHGTTVHGVQNLGSPDRERMATSYYATRSGVGLAMAAAPQMFGDHARIAVVGLGAGTLACYARPGQQWTFYEIDPAVVQIARDPARFTFLSRCKPDARVEIGDARMLIEHEPAAAADILVVDAFSSDAVPMHLLTRQAFAGYRRLLSNQGLLLVHISNRYVDLTPVVAGAAAADGWEAWLRSYRPTLAAAKLNESGSDWVAISPSAGTVRRFVAGSGEPWNRLPADASRAWTDDYASILPLVRWNSWR